MDSNLFKRDRRPGSELAVREGLVLGFSPAIQISRARSALAVIGKVRWVGCGEDAIGSLTCSVYTDPLSGRQPSGSCSGPADVYNRTGMCPHPPASLTWARICTGGGGGREGATQGKR